MLRPTLRRRQDEPVLPQCRPKRASKRSLLRRQLFWAAAGVAALVLYLGSSLLGRWVAGHRAPRVPPLRLHADLFAESLWLEAEARIALPRGIVLPLYDDIALLGFSLLMELRSLGVELPVEVPHCGDLSPALQTQLSLIDPLAVPYDVCEAAEAAADGFYADRKLFCADLADCRARFQGFDVKILGVLYSRFDEVMLLDADTLFFRDPTALFATAKYADSGTLFFHDRITSEFAHLAARVDGQRGDVRRLHHYLASFDVGPFQHLNALPRAAATTAATTAAATASAALPVSLPISPSEILLESHAWGLRSGHQMDSSLLLWHKRRQPRATAILASFVSLNGVARPPSYGDKELFFLACELAETRYAFSDYGVGTVGSRLLRGRAEPLDILDELGEEAAQVGPSVLCGDALHYWPELDAAANATTPLYINSDDILEWDASRVALLRTAARRAEFFPGSFKQRGYPQSCPFDVTVVALLPGESARFARRQALYQSVARGRDDLEVWIQAAKTTFLRWIDAL